MEYSVWTRSIYNDFEIIGMSLLLPAPNTAGALFFTTDLSRHSDQDKLVPQDYPVPNLVLVYSAPRVSFTLNLVLSYPAPKYVIPQLQMCSRPHWCSLSAKNLGRRKPPPSYNLF